MKKLLIYLACVGALLFTPVIASAVSGWTDYSNVNELIPTAHGRFNFKLSVTENPSGCKNKEMFFLDYSASGAEQMYDTLLQAVISGKKVRVYVTGRCELKGYSEISSVGIIL